jgi:hypothetical protein
MTWMSARPPEELKAMQEYGTAVRGVFRSLQDLRDKAQSPASPEVQSLITEWNTLAVRYGLRQFMANLMEWNPAVGQKWLQVGERALSLSMAQHQTGSDDGLWAYFGAAQEASPWHQALQQTAEQAVKLAEGQVDPSSAPAKALAHQMTRICSENSLGTPLVYARWASAMQFRGSTVENARRKSAWAYIVRTLEAGAPHF